LCFEVRYTDLAARIGILETPHGNIETPSFIPVVHPVKQSVSTQFLKSLGFKAVITNAYIALQYLGNKAKTKGIHDVIDYDGVIMTDSGGYQVLEYGSIEVEPREIAQFEIDIGSDICVPLDKPTGFGLSYAKSEDFVNRTLENAKATLEIVAENKKARNIGTNKNKENCVGGAIWAGPIQGSEHFDLLEHSVQTLDKMGFELMAIGSPVELMESYNFSLLCQMIAKVKRLIPAKPIHLFGAGHPLTIPLAVALGCDTFDSASYMLYARDNRYMYGTGTARLEDLSYFSCPCPICSIYTVKELLDMDQNKRTIEIAKHNLYVLKAEVLAVKQAIKDGRLWEYVMLKARAHPKLMEAVELFSGFEFLEKSTPIFKDKAIFLYSPIDQFRPEVKRFRKIISSFRSKKKILLLHPDTGLHPFYSTKEFTNIVKKFNNAQICAYNPFLGVIPAEVSDIYPAAHNLIAQSSNIFFGHQAKDYPSFIESLNGFIAKNNFEEIIVLANNFMRDVFAFDPVLNKMINIKILDHESDISFRLRT
jgi:7-cyano-7-deazaguanine tRNA-ribosyltransferase